jgi:hypothetical protein
MTTHDVQQIERANASCRARTPIGTLARKPAFVRRLV